MEARPIGFVAGVAFTLALVIACDQGAMQAAMMQDGGTSASTPDLLRAADAQTTPAAAGPVTMTAKCDKTSTRGATVYHFAEFSVPSADPAKPLNVSAWMCELSQIGFGLSCNGDPACVGYSVPEPTCAQATTVWQSAGKIIVWCGLEGSSIAKSARITITQ